jgi:hypothetical protein
MHNLGHIISKEIKINKDIDWLFDFTQDFNERLKWDKQTKEIAFMEGYKKLEKRAKVYTVSAEGIKMETEYLKFEPSKVISIRMLNRSSVFKEFVGTWNYISIAESSCVLRITYEYTLRFPYGLVKGLVSNKVSRNISHKLTFLQSYLEEK